MGYGGARHDRHCLKAKDFDEYRFEFQRTFEKTRTPLGANPLHKAIEQAASCPPPPEAARYPSAKIKRLAAVCFQLQLLAGKAPFFIGARNAAAVLGTKKPETGLTILTGLVRDGVLTVIQKGEAGGNRATRYRYNQAVTSEPRPKVRAGEASKDDVQRCAKSLVAAPSLR